MTPTENHAPATRPPLKKATFTKEYSDWLSAMLKWMEGGRKGKMPVRKDLQ